MSSPAFRCNKTVLNSVFLFQRRTNEASVSTADHVIEHPVISCCFLEELHDVNKCWVKGLLHLHKNTFLEETRCACRFMAFKKSNLKALCVVFLFSWCVSSWMSAMETNSSVGIFLNLFCILLFEFSPALLKLFYSPSSTDHTQRKQQQP